MSCTHNPDSCPALASPRSGFGLHRELPSPAPQFKGVGGLPTQFLLALPGPTAGAPSCPTVGRPGGLSIEAFLRPAGAVGFGLGGWHCALVNGPLGFPSLRAGYQATASKGSALALGWHSYCCQVGSHAVRPVEARVSSGGFMCLGGEGMMPQICSLRNS